MQQEAREGWREERAGERNGPLANRGREGGKETERCQHETRKLHMHHKHGLNMAPRIFSALCANKK